MQQKAFIYIHVLLNEGLVKAQNKPMLKCFGTKAKTTAWEHPQWQSGRCCSDCSVLPPRNLRSHGSPGLQGSPIYGPARWIYAMHLKEAHQKNNLLHFQLLLKMQGCSEASLMLKALLTVLVHDEYKSAMKLNHRTACPCLCQGVWDLTLFVCWLQLWFPWRELTGCVPGPGLCCALPDQQPVDRQRWSLQKENKSGAKLTPKLSQDPNLQVLRKGTEVGKTGETLKLGKQITRTLPAKSSVKKPVLAVILILHVLKESKINQREQISCDTCTWNHDYSSVASYCLVSLLNCSVEYLEQLIL